MKIPDMEKIKEIQKEKANSHCDLMRGHLDQPSLLDELGASKPGGNEISESSALPQLWCICKMNVHFCGKLEWYELSNGL